MATKKEGAEVKRNPAFKKDLDLKIIKRLRLPKSAAK